MSLARLLNRVSEIDLEHWPSCRGELKIIDAIPEAPAIEKNLLTGLTHGPSFRHPSIPTSRAPGEPAKHPGLPRLLSESHFADKPYGDALRPPAPTNIDATD
jgi:hypothetical protein